MSEDLIRQLVAQDRLDDALDELNRLVHASDAELRREVISLRQRLFTAQKKRRQGVASSAADTRARTELGDSILEIVDEFAEARQPLPTGPVPVKGSPLVFISYAHADREVADRLKSALEQQGVSIRIDHVHMRAGESIASFIQRSVRDSHFTVSIVSNKSLLSTWVATETLQTVQAETLNNSSKFIAGYIDKDMFDPQFRLMATRSIDEKLKELDALTLGTLVTKSIRTI